MKTPFGHLWMVLLYFLSILSLSADSANILKEGGFEIIFSASLKALSLKS